MVIAIHNRWYPIILLLDDIQFDQQICDMQYSSDIVVVEHFKLDLCSNFAICFMGIKRECKFFVACFYWLWICNFRNISFDWGVNNMVWPDSLKTNLSHCSILFIHKGILFCFFYYTNDRLDIKYYYSWMIELFSKHCIFSWGLHDQTTCLLWLRIILMRLNM